jgi:ATP-binding cassette subfamily F protein 3
VAVLTASGLGKDVAGAPLLRGVSFKLERRDRLTLAGRNGSGKTTLLRMLAGEASIDGGQLTVAKGARVALHDQRPPRESGVQLRDYVLGGAALELELEAELSRLEQAMAAGAGDPATLGAYADAQARLETRGGYRWRDRALAIARGLGFADGEEERELETLSGGELTRASLARTLATGAEVMLLDEPTNHLDIEALEWLEQTLIGLDAAIVLVAHDRWFLETVGTSVLELQDGRARFFDGSWHAWRREQAARELALGRAVERQQAEIARLERFVGRFRAGTRARQAQARVKRLERIERLDPGRHEQAAPRFAFRPPARSGRVTFELEGARIVVGERPIVLLENCELWLERGEHVSLVGPNGSGKTTLIETLVGVREPASGKLRRGHGVNVGYLAQHADDFGEDGSVVDAVQRATGLTPNAARGLLGRFLFSGEDADKQLTALSGGERQRLSLAILVAGGVNVLVLDEPTNHLDLESREALEDALTAFAGSVLLVSHDRALLDAIGSRTIAIEDRTLRSYVGGWAEYLRVRTQAPPLRAAEPEQPAPTPAKPKREGPSKNRVREQERREGEVEAAEAALRALEDELSEPAAWATPYESAKSEARHTAARRAVDAAYARLEEVIDDG